MACEEPQVLLRGIVLPRKPDYPQLFHLRGVAACLFPLVLRKVSSRSAGYGEQKYGSCSMEMRVRTYWALGLLPLVSPSVTYLRISA